MMNNKRNTKNVFLNNKNKLRDVTPLGPTDMNETHVTLRRSDVR